MIKLIWLLGRMQGMSVTEFHDSCLRVYAARLAAIPSLRAGVLSLTLLEAYERYEPAYDAMAELWFDDLAALRAAEGGAEWQQAVSEAARSLGRSDRLVASEVAVVDALPSPREREGLVKYASLLTRSEGLEVGEFQRHWREIHGPLVAQEFPGMLRYVQSHPLPETYDTALHPAYDGVPEAWFESLDVLPWALVRRTGDELDTAAARDSRSIFVQPIPSLLTREISILG